MADPATCHGCDAAPIRETGEYVTTVECWTDQRLYCRACATAWARGDFEGETDA